MTIKEVENRIRSFSYDKENLDQESVEFLQRCHLDERKGIQSIIRSYLKQQQKHQQELLRSHNMYNFEMELWHKGIVTIAGTDEVGRGCVAGPVVAAAVILPLEPMILGLNDSKKLTPIQREELNVQIRLQAIDIAIGEVDAQTIDKIGIVAATFAAMKQAIHQLMFKPDYILVDAFAIPGLDIPQSNIIGGDGKAASIAAASIVAKVYRDQKMVEYHAQFSDYGLNQHKGYGTREHMEAIRTYGFTPLHRKSFLKEITF
ncbi:ribonuclease HII [Desulfuribacillus stibiiarsenatis]|uniref:Ribonuclease HII n=1 Tax=Desulfuribacillus stibiiarsenatis TaxID=1390249 RepID=A0A1E5L756_9FIRM|nr:ribonuclease HII [Desulfuribacillus stibiiarsenatis]